MFEVKTKFPSVTQRCHPAVLKFRPPSHLRFEHAPHTKNFKIQVPLGTLLRTIIEY
jgi:hypothetical protein